MNFEIKSNVEVIRFNLCSWLFGVQQRLIEVKVVFETLDLQESVPAFYYNITG